jgi:sialate O-acetylesterase
MTVRLRLAAALAELAVGLSCAAASPAAGQALLHPMFQDHAVLQRGRPIPVYGAAPAGSRIIVAVNGISVHAIGGADGTWRAQLPAMAAGGPYTLSAAIAGGASEQAHDVMVGDVFLCGGQSNMQFPVKGADNAREEIATANDPDLRAMTIAMHASPTPLARFADPVAWLPTTPKTVGDLSAC